MKRKILKITTGGLAAIVVSQLLSCGDGTGPEIPIPGTGVHHVDVTPSLDTLKALGATLQFSAVARTANNNPVSNVSITWNSSAPSVATVDGNGLVTAVGRGSAKIRATATPTGGTGGATGEATAVIVQVAIGISVNPAPIALAPGETAQLTASAVDARSNPIVGALFTWQSSNASVATVNSSGLVTAQGQGSAIITAKRDDAEGSSSVTVLVVELVKVRSLVLDPFTLLLMDYIAAQTGNALKAAFAEIEEALLEGDIPRVEAALAVAQSIIDQGNPEDAVLLAYLTLVVERCQALIAQI